MYLVHGGEYQRVVIIVAHNIAMAFLAGVALVFPVQKYKSTKVHICRSYSLGFITNSKKTYFQGSMLVKNQ